MRMRHAGHEVCMADRRRKPKGKRPLRSPKCRWDYNIIMDFKEIV